jgi:hypothetical protein
VFTFTCNGIDDLNCSDFNFDTVAATLHLQQCGVETDEDNLDGNNNGQACEAAE